MGGTRKNKKKDAPAAQGATVAIEKAPAKNKPLSAIMIACNKVTSLREELEAETDPAQKESIAKNLKGAKKERDTLRASRKSTSIKLGTSRFKSEASVGTTVLTASGGVKLVRTGGQTSTATKEKISQGTFDVIKLSRAQGAVRFTPPWHLRAMTEEQQRSYMRFAQPGMHDGTEFEALNKEFTDGKKFMDVKDSMTRYAAAASARVLAAVMKKAAAFAIDQTPRGGTPRITVSNYMAAAQPFLDKCEFGEFTWLVPGPKDAAAMEVEPEAEVA